MGFWSFFKHVGHSIGHAVSHVTHFVSKAAHFIVSVPKKVVSIAKHVGKTIAHSATIVYKKVIKPVGKALGKSGVAIYNHVIKPVGKVVGKIATDAAHVAENLGNAASFLTKLPVLIAIGIGAVILLPKIMDSKAGKKAMMTTPQGRMMAMARS